MRPADNGVVASGFRYRGDSRFDEFLGKNGPYRTMRSSSCRILVGVFRQGARLKTTLSPERNRRFATCSCRSTPTREKNKRDSDRRVLSGAVGCGARNSREIHTSRIRARDHTFLAKKISAGIVVRHRLLAAGRFSPPNTGAIALGRRTIMGDNCRNLDDNGITHGTLAAHGLDFHLHLRGGFFVISAIVLTGIRLGAWLDLIRSPGIAVPGLALR